MDGTSSSVSGSASNSISFSGGRWGYGNAEVITGPPDKVSNINLARGAYVATAADATNQQLDVSVQWDRPSMAQSYDVYIGPSEVGLALDSDGQIARVYAPTLALDSTYFMRIDSVNTEGTTTGDVFSFSTWSAEDILTDGDGVPVTDGNGDYIETISA